MQQMFTCAVIMLLPIKAETFHLGTAMVTTAAMRPKIPSAIHTICTPDEPILKEE